MAEKEMSPEMIAAFAASCEAMGKALKAASTEMAVRTGRIAEAQRARRATPFNHARAHLMGKRWTEQEAEHLKEIIDQGAAQVRIQGDG